VKTYAVALGMKGDKRDGGEGLVSWLWKRRPDQSGLGSRCTSSGPLSRSHGDGGSSLTGEGFTKQNLQGARGASYDPVRKAWRLVRAKRAIKNKIAENVWSVPGSPGVLFRAFFDVRGP